MARAPNGTEQEIWNDVTGISFGSWSKIASGFREPCQRNGRLVTQTISDKGMDRTRLQLCIRFETYIRPQDGTREFRPERRLTNRTKRCPNVHGSGFP